MGNVLNLRMGVASISVNGVDVGNTLGGVKVTITRKMVDIKADKYGESPVDKILTDVQMKIETKVAEPIATLIAKALPESALNTAGSGSQLGIGAGEGNSFRATAAQIVLHPIAKGSDLSEDVVMYMGVSTTSPVLNYEVANQRVFDLMFEALVSEAYTPGRRLGHIGPVNIS